MDDNLAGRRDRRYYRRGNRSDDRQRRPGWKNNRDYDYSRRVTIATAFAEDLLAELDEHRAHQDSIMYHFESGESSRDQVSDYSSDEAGAEESHPL